MKSNMIHDVYRAIRKRVILILLIAILAATATGIINFYVLIPNYQENATVLVQPQNVNNMNIYTSALGNQQLLKTYAELIKSRRIASDVIHKLSLDMEPNQLLSKVNVKTTNGTFLIVITVTDHDPALAVRYVNAFAQTFSQNINVLLNVDNVLVVDEAELSQNPVPVSPNPYLNIPVAAVLGMLGGIGLALLLEIMSLGKHAATVKARKNNAMTWKIPVADAEGYPHANNANNTEVII